MIPATSTYCPFETPAFHEIWWKHFPQKYPVKDRYKNLMVVKRPRLKGLLTLQEMAIAGWNNAWNQDLDSKTAEDLLTFSQKTDWHYFKVHWNDTREAFQAFRLLEEAGLQLHHIPDQPQYVIDLQGGFEAYMMRKSLSNRKDIRKKLKKVEPLQPRLEFYDHADQLTSYFEQFFAYHIQYWDNKSGYSFFHDETERAFMLDWGRELLREGRLILDGYFLNDKLVNQNMSIIADDRTIYTFMTINTPAYADLYPGITSLYHRLMLAAERGCTTYKMGPGDYPYKIQASSYQESCKTLYIANPKSVIGKLYVAKAIRGATSQNQATAPSEQA